MKSFFRAISTVFIGAAKAFQTFPAAIINALGFSIVTMIRIQLDWPQQEAYNFLFNCLHWSFALGAVFSLAAITGAQSRTNKKQSFWIANGLGIAMAGIVFVMLYLFGGTSTAVSGTSMKSISGLAATRVSVAILISLLTFIVLASIPKEQSDFARSLLMTEKAFFIALIYGLVIMGGSSGVAGAFQALLYREMSTKVYMYISTISGFLAFTIFLGYFPDFRKGIIDGHREVAQQQPRFLEILFGYIMIPILLALTVVLLMWGGRTIATSTWPNFMQLSRIAMAYAIGGIWLHIMVTHHESGLANAFRRIFPISALVILGFAAWALFIQLGNTGLKLTEYTFILVSITAAASLVMLFTIKARAHPWIAGLICVVAVLAVMPGIGYHALPAQAQINRLESLLRSEDMLVNDQVVLPETEPDLAVREAITDAVRYLAYAEDTKMPPWFERRYVESAVFRATFGFEQVWPEPDFDGGFRNMGVSLSLPPGVVDISDYRWVVNLQDNYGREETSVIIDGDYGRYRISWLVNPEGGAASLRIEQDERLILQQEMDDYFDRIAETYPLDQSEPRKATFEDMSLRLETPELEILLVFRHVEFYIDSQQDSVHKWIDVNALYMNEKTV